MKAASIAVLLCCPLLWAGSPAKHSESLYITNVNVVDTRYGVVEPHVTVVIENGVVKGFAKVAIIDSRPGVRVVNAGGKYLVPGFWDMNAQLSGAPDSTWDNRSLYALYLANGVVGLREAQGEKETISLVNTLWSGSEAPSAAPRIGGSALPDRPPSTRAITDVYELLKGCCSKSEDPAPGSEIAAHFQEDDPPTVQPIQVYDPQKTREAFEGISETGGWIVPGLVSVEAPIASVSENDWKAIDDPFTLGKSTPRMQTLLQQRERLQQALQLAHTMWRAGVRMLAGTSGPREHVIPGRSLHRELQLLVKTGMTPFEALQSATFNAALYVAKLDKYGVVEPGHVADLVLLDANPLDDISNTEKISGVILDGRYFSRAELDRLAASATENKPQMAGANSLGGVNTAQY